MCLHFRQILWRTQKNSDGKHQTLGASVAQATLFFVCWAWHEFVWTCIWSISTFPPPQPLPPFLFSGAISRRWRSDTFDNCGPHGVNAAAIACSSVPLCLYHQHINMPFSNSPDWCKERWGWELESIEDVLLFCFLTHYMCLFYNTKLLRLPFFTAIRSKHPSQRADNDSCEE